MVFLALGLIVTVLAMAGASKGASGGSAPPRDPRAIAAARRQAQLDAAWRRDMEEQGWKFGED